MTRADYWEAFNFQNESVQSSKVEVSNLRDKITSLEAALSSVAEEKVQNEVSIN